MSTPKDGGPAFPGMDYISHDGKVNPCGMSLRDWFAGQALAGNVASFSNSSNISPASHVAVWCYQMADAMLAAREAKP